ncbi:MAG: helix-turn-helix transcriptional regulator [Oscillospiraceae bacterium]|jgi:transcriptional regulator with XRE-family HTH domain|nr:helix-turn-helix transcriptional regulator [Oscillospiraceae bacterium]
MKPNERLKYLRKEILELTQVKFAARIGMSRPNLGNIEVGRIELTSRTIQDICREFNINRLWLETGEGEIRNSDDDIIIETYIEKLCLQKGFGESGREFFRIFLELGEFERKFIMVMSQRLLDSQVSNCISPESIKLAKELLNVKNYPANENTTPVWRAAKTDREENNKGSESASESTSAQVIAVPNEQLKDLKERLDSMQDANRDDF